MALLASIASEMKPMHEIHDACFRRCLQHETSLALVEGMMCLAVCACVHVHDVQCMCICLVRAWTYEWFFAVAFASKGQPTIRPS